MPNVTSETHNSSSIAVAAAIHFGYLFLLLLHRLLLLLLLAPGWKTPWKKSPAGRKTPCLWRTEKPQNCTPKMPNVTSETHNSSSSSSSIAVAAAMHFGYLFLLLLHRLLLLLLLLTPGWKTPWKKSPAGRKTPSLWRTEKPQNCTPKMPNVTSETHNSSSIAVAAAMHFGYLFLLLLHRLLLLLLLAPGWKTPWKKSPAGRKTPCLWRTEKPQNCTPKMPNVTSETHNSSSIAVAAAMHFGYLFLLLLHRLLLPFAAAAAGSRMENTMEKITCRQENTMPLKDGEAPKLHPENA